MWCSISLLMVGCSGSNNPFADAVPTRASLQINVPGASQPATASSTSSVGVAQEALVGQLASFYVATRDATRGFNDGVGGFLANIEHILSQPPSAQSATHAVWGPTNDALSPASFRFEIEKLKPNAYAYAFSGKPKGAPDTDWQVVIDGATVVVDPGHSMGDFHVDQALASKLDMTAPPDQDAIHVHFDNTVAPRVLDIAFDKAGANDANYQYTENPDGSGTFHFVTPETPNASGALMRTAIASQWTSSGQGRADVAAMVDNPTMDHFAAAECWDSAFARTYYIENGNPATAEGDPKSCAF
jgi:hypothetical protein